MLTLAETTRILMDALDARMTFTSELDPGALIDGDLFASFATGDYPAARLVHVARVAEGNGLSLPHGRVTRTVAWEETRWLLVEGPTWRVRFRADSDGETWAWVLGIDAAVVEDLSAQISRWNEPAPLKPDSVEVTFCFRGERGLNRRRRKIHAPSWPSISLNYTSSVRDRFDRLVAAEPNRLDGRLVLLWGPPGTGKTTLLRTLAREWTPWCDTVYVSDPERLFSEAAYLNSILLEGEGGVDEPDDDRATRWTLLLLEDCDELIRPDAKNASGQALSRLLNLTDGMVGQGLQLLVCLTTNEELWRLHPAVTRPGRCLAQIEVGRLNRAEAARWLTEHDAADAVAGSVGPDGLTLAELIALRNGTPALSLTPSTSSVGHYL